jgi:hypothetical protein
MKRCLIMAAIALLYASASYADGNELKELPRIVTDNQSITITTTSANTIARSTSGAGQAHIQLKFGTVAGSYNLCTMQAYTSMDNGSSYVTFGDAKSVTVSTGAKNIWSLAALSPAAPSGSAATNFGYLTYYKFACSSYGTSASAKIHFIYSPAGSTAAADNGSFLTYYDSTLTSLTSSLTALTAATTLVRLAYCTNTDTASHTITIANTAGNYYVGPAFALPALSNVTFWSNAAGLKMVGIKWNADVANKVNCQITGLQ